jgi:uncharacterized protein
MPDILKEILKNIPEKAKISDALFEGANIVLYTKSRDFFLDNSRIIKDIVNTIKKRIEVRPDPCMTMDIEETKKIIENLLPKDVGAINIIFDQQRSRVIIEAEKPGLAIGKSGDLLKEIKKSTLWVPLVRRIPSIRSKLIENIRQVLYENNDYRRNFLNKTGERIYSGWQKEKKNAWVRLTVLGGGRQVGRSCFLIQTQESRVLLDAGVDVAAPEKYAYPFFDCPEFNINELDAIILSHPHSDHSAMIPLIFKYGYRGPVYCTAPTRDITALMTLDYIGVAFKEAKRAPYTSTDVKEMVKHTICLDYEEVYDITPDIRLTLYNAGHTLGSAMVHLHIGNGLHNFLYTGDLKYQKTQLLESAITKFPRLETVMVEATYGGKDNIQPPRKECEQEIIDTIQRTIDRGGKVLIPVLGVGRAQEVMLILEKLIREGKMKNIPVYVQGMVWDVTAIHTAYPDFLNKDVKKAIFHQDKNPFMSPIFKKVGSTKERQQIMENEGPCVILATSGMLQGGASVEFFKQMADNPKHTIIFVSYLGEGSLGRRVQSGEKQLMLENDRGVPIMTPVKLEVVTIDGLSGHASRTELTKFIYNLDPRPKKVIIVHGENSRCLDLASTLHKMGRIETNAPKNLEAVRIR